MVLLPKKYILVQRRKEVSGSMEKAPKKYPSLKEVAPVTLAIFGHFHPISPEIFAIAQNFPILHLQDTTANVQLGK